MKNIHIVPHTHWDREWYKPFQHFRVKLVYVIDSLLNILENDVEFSYFLLDGQTIVLEDYLQIRPENQPRITKLIQDGRIQVGPWYIQPDEFAPDGESLVRNLLIGMAISSKFGEPMKVGYLPDSFGHSGQMPQILRGFGIDSAVVMRGVDADKIKRSEFTWRGENGDEVFAVYLPNGYSNGMFLPKGFREFKYRLLISARNLGKWATTNNILIMNGVDHQFPQDQITEHIQRLNSTGKRKVYSISTLDRYIEQIKGKVPKLPVLESDLLIPARNRVHSSIASTRIYQKQKNRRMESLLEKYVEPVSTIAWLIKADYPAGLINQAWKYLIQNQTHDGLCGCCLDQVHREMDQRFTDVETIGETLKNTYARAIARNISCDKLYLVTFNNSFTRGMQIVKASIFTKNKKFSLLDSSGKVIPYQINKSEEVDIADKSIWTLYLKSKEHTYQTDITFRIDFDFNVGYKVFEIQEGADNPEIEPAISINRNIIQNQLISVEINQNGSLHIRDKESDRIFENQHILEDCGDAGDTYNYSPVKNDTVISSQNSEAAFKITRQDAHSVEATIYYELEIPEKLVNQDTERSTKLVKIPITTRMTIHANQKRIDFSTEINNLVDDHRIRVLFPTGIQTYYSYAETQFGTVKRKIKPDNIVDWRKKKWHEKPLPIYAQQKFVDINNGTAGLAVLNRGLPEYEIYQDQDSTIAITLLRGIGSMGKGNLLIRPGRPSGIKTPTPDAQCHGIQKLEYALYPHVGDIEEENIPKQAAIYDANPLTVQNHLQYKSLVKKFKLLLNFISLETLTGHVTEKLGEIGKGDLNLITISDDRLLISAVKKSENEDELVLRFYNSSPSTVKGGSILIGLKTEDGWITDLNENTLGKLEKLSPGEFLIPDVKPNTAVTTKFLVSY